MEDFEHWKQLPAWQSLGLGDGSQLLHGSGLGGPRRCKGYLEGYYICFVKEYTVVASEVSKGHHKISLLHGDDRLILGQENIENAAPPDGDGLL